MSRYETPGALRHDAGTVMDDARHVLAATSDLKDRTVSEARYHLESAIDRLRDTVQRMEHLAVDRARDTDACIRRHPYASIALAVGVGALLGRILFNDRWR